jgi:hypothetical protein
MRRHILFLTAIAAALPCVAPAVHAQAGNAGVDTTMGRRTGALAQPVTSGMTLRVGGSWYDNFFQTPSAQPHRSVGAGTADLRLVHGLGATRRSSVRARAGATAFDGLPTSIVAEAGARAASAAQMLDLNVIAFFDSPRFEVGESLERADAIGATLEYGFLVGGALQVGLLADASRERYESVSRNDNVVRDLGGSLRWRGFGSNFSPEVGFLVGRREVDNDQESFDQRAWWLQLRTSLRRNLYASARFRRRDREYDTGDVTARNFGREDTRDQLTAGVTLTPRLGPAWDLYYSMEDVSSSRPERGFTAHALSLGATFRVGRW